MSAMICFFTMLILCIGGKEIKISDDSDDTNGKVE